MCIACVLSQLADLTSGCDILSCMCLYAFVSCVCVQSSSLSGILSVRAVVILATGILSLRWIYWQHVPPLLGQLFNYPGLLIFPGTRHSGAEAGPAPVNDWLFLRGPLGAGRRRGDRRSLREQGLFCSAAAAFALFTSSPDCSKWLKIAFYRCFSARILPKRWWIDDWKSLDSIQITICQFC